MSKPIYHKYLPTISDGLKSGKSLNQIGRELASENGWTDNSGMAMVKRWAKRIGSEIGPVIIQSVTRETWSDEIPEGEKPTLSGKKINGVGRVLILSDIHLPYHNKEALLMALKWGREFNPDTIILNGDIVDFEKVSSFLPNPKKPDIRYELDVCNAFFTQLRYLFPKANIYFKKGNHEDRLMKYVHRNAAALADLIDFNSIMKFNEHGILFHDNNIFLQMGNLFVVHGHEVYGGIGAINVAKVVLERTNVNTICGHFHKTNEFPKKTLGGETITCYTTGCFQNDKPDYAPVNAWNHGFAAVEFDNKGNFWVHNKKIINGRVM